MAVNELKTDNKDTVTRRFKMELSFDGTDFQGWQIQPDQPSIQQILQEKLSGLFGNFPVKLTGSSRTDAGVHAQGFAASFSAPESPYIPDEKLKTALNNMLPDSIHIKNIEQTDKEFHARYSALAKAYTYAINLGEETPFSSRWTWKWDKCNTEALKAGAAHLVGKHDFAAYAVKSSQREDTVRIIYRIDVQQFNNILCLTFIGNGFLYKMIRSIMGTLASVAREKLPPKTVKDILESKDRSCGEPTSPPTGLFLMKVFYKDKEWEDFKINTPPFYCN
jgi:tRNA pseudouridine38-40 synthase